MKVRQAKRVHMKRAGEAFPSRMAKKQALKAALVAALIESPTTHGMLENMGHVRSPEEEDTQIAAGPSKTSLLPYKQQNENDPTMQGQQ